MSFAPVTVAFFVSFAAVPTAFPVFFPAVPTAFPVFFPAVPTAFFVSFAAVPTAFFVFFAAFLVAVLILAFVESCFSWALTVVVAARTNTRASQRIRIISTSSHEETSHIVRMRW